MKKKSSVSCIFWTSKAKKIGSSILLFCFCAFCIFCQTKTLTLGGEEGWGKIATQTRITTGKGRFGYESLELAKNNRKQDANTDLLLDFEDLSKRKDKTGNYDVVHNALLSASSGYIGKGTALSSDSGGIALVGNKKALFGKSGFTGSFLIEFWLNPTLAQNGEKIFSWRSSRNVNDVPIYQMMTAVFLGNRLEWNFTNVFEGVLAQEGEITLSSYRTIIPNKWSFYQLSYDDETGLLELIIDGQTEDLKYITVNGRQNSSTCQAVLGVVANIEICSHFTGLLDDFRILTCSAQQMSDDQKVSAFYGYDMYPVSCGRFESEPLLVSKGSVLHRLEGIYNIPEQTDIRFYVRTGDNYFQWDENYPQWKAVSPSIDFAGLQGKYFQVAAELFSDGGQSKTPSITQISLIYDEQDPPPPPFGVFASSGNGEVTLCWARCADDITGGYYVYYGTRPGEYLGKASSLGTSPIDVSSKNKVTLTGLENGKIYYFAIAGYSKYDSMIIGAMSKEVFARPSADIARIQEEYKNR